MEVPVRIGPHAAHEAALVCEEAFRGSALTEYLFPGSVPRDSGVTAMFEFIVKYAMLNAEVYATSAKLEGIASWYSEKSARFSLPGFLRSGSLGLIVRHRAAWQRLVGTEKYLQGARERHLRGRYYYLDVLAVRPGLHGKGYGGTLLRHLLAMAASEHVPCFLETFTEGNVLMYERFGFRVVETSQIPGMSAPVHFMART